MPFPLRGFGDTVPAAGSVPITDFLDGALTWADDFQGSMLDSLNLVFGQPTVAIDQPVTAAKVAGFMAVPVAVGLLGWVVAGAITRGAR